ncbi:VMA21 domain-containing [Pyrrhoderma noxium]|uniref:VMA21 domain-containing n=1 Tax=Pyrrhoderma noxium TaxID=2282107 RepID=A0A286UNM0_9AGAM|nr:VMA21 domain-containing [Pyrrhoderma noxium]
MSSQAASAKLADNAAQGGTLIKLILFAVSLAVVPLSTYFGTLNNVWKGDSTFAAISAVFAANFVLVAYIVQSVYEDKERGNVKSEENKDGETHKKK